MTVRSPNTDVRDGQSRAPQSGDEVPVRPKQRASGHSTTLSVTNVNLDAPMRLRVGHLLTLFSISHATLYRRIRQGRLPPPDGSDGRPYWMASTVKPLLVVAAG